ncbi:MAG: ABC transporter permease [Anaerolineae bacterium]|nr:ABC transporter permease [Anaerolineae bacterium]
MTELSNAIWIELRKATRSRMPLLTGVGFLLVPLATGFIMYIYKNPDLARAAGLISAKANLIGGIADWPTYLNMLAQAIAIGGLFLFTLIGGWVFGREFADGTLKDLLALPVSRSTILLAKFVVIALWSAALTIMILLVGLIVGTLVGLPQGSTEVFVQGSYTLVATALMTVAVVTPMALFASVGRGYLLPIGVALLMLMFANVLALAGWGDYFPWAVPAIYAEAGGASADLGPVSYAIVLVTGLVGMIGTYLWWQRADQSR